ncbi:hypothetical protein OIO90_006430 [Microbotryomycetes sp. JL221]|nr:hypothetical protein OIO90_006430 [Microbotryomycetes sp. JL221]
MRHRSATSIAFATETSTALDIYTGRKISKLSLQWRRKSIAEWLHLFVFCACLLVFVLATSGFGAERLHSTKSDIANAEQGTRADTIDVDIPDTFKPKRSAVFGREPIQFGEGRAPASDETPTTNERFKRVVATASSGHVSDDLDDGDAEVLGEQASRHSKSATNLSNDGSTPGSGAEQVSDAESINSEAELDEDDPVEQSETRIHDTPNRLQDYS